MAAKKQDIFAKDETVLGFHGPLLYDAKVLQVEAADGKAANHKYFVHYLKWSKKWDEWVGAERLLRDTPENRSYQESLKTQQGKGGAAGTGADEKKGNNKRKGDEKAAGKKGSKKRKVEEEDETVEDDSAEKKEIKVKIPGALKKQLITDWENVTRKNQLVQLPREHTVTKVLEDFVKSKKAKANAEDMAKEVVSGVRQYFERSLGKILLYRFERTQFSQINEVNETKGKNVCDVYGAEHLLRLFVKLPGLLAHTQMKHKETTLLSAKLTEFIKFLAKKQSTYFTSKYIEASADYKASMSGATSSSSAASS